MRLLRGNAGEAGLAPLNGVSSSWEEDMSKTLVRGLLAGAALTAFGASLARADDDAAYIEKAKAYLQNVAAPVTKWDGPTSGPKAPQGKKLIVMVVTDARNGGAQGAADGAVEAAKALGW